MIQVRATAQQQLLEEDDMKAPPKAPQHGAVGHCVTA